MANKSIFSSAPRGRSAPVADAVNEAGGLSYKLGSKHALAQLAVTGTLSPTFYADGEAQLGDVVAAAKECEPGYIAKVAVWSRQRGNMKDMPAVLLAHLASRGADGIAALKSAWSHVVDSGKMLRNFVQVIRSGKLGRKSLGAAPKKLVRSWLAGRSAEKLFDDAVGNAPSIADVIKMAHPRPADPARAALYRYLIGKELDAEQGHMLPDVVAGFEAFKAGKGDGDPPAVSFQRLTQLKLSKEQWARIAERGRWHQTRMNLNTYARHSAFKVDGLAEKIAAKLRDPEAVRSAKAFPYQLLATYRACSTDVPLACREAVQDAMEVALENVPEIAGDVVVCVDVSGSMQSPVTGDRGSATTAVRCVDVASLVASAILRKNRQARVIPFGTDVCQVELNPRDTVLTNADKLAKINGGGTNCSAPLALLNREKAKADLVLYVSDNESWVDSSVADAILTAGGIIAPAEPPTCKTCGVIHYVSGVPLQSRGTQTMIEWEALRVRSQNARLVNVDLQPNTTVQAPSRKDILNLGGWSDACFGVVASFLAGTLGPDAWVGEIEKIDLAAQEVRG